MKAYKKIFASVLIAALACSFFACADDSGDEDENLTVVFTPNAGAVSEGTGVRLVASDSSSIEGSTEIYYTTDGTDLVINSWTSATDNGKTTYTPIFSSENVKKYSGAITITAETTIKACSVKTTAKVYGSPCTAAYTIATTESGVAEVSRSELPDTFQFGVDDDKISFLYYSSEEGSGDGVSTKGRFGYFKGKDQYDNCQYQIQFSAKKWALYTRVAYGAILESLEQGTYTGDPWKDGIVTLKIDDTDWQTVTISDTAKSGNKVTDGKFLLNVAEVNTKIGAYDPK